MRDKAASRMVERLAARGGGIDQNPVVQSEKAIRLVDPHGQLPEIAIGSLLRDEASSVEFIQRLAYRVRATLAGLRDKLDEARHDAIATNAAITSLERRAEDAEAEAKAARLQLLHLEREYLLLRLKAQEAEIRALIAESSAREAVLARRSSDV